jgi:hypothetical protein
VLCVYDKKLSSIRSNSKMVVNTGWITIRVMRFCKEYTCIKYKHSSEILQSNIWLQELFIEFFHGVQNLDMRIETHFSYILSSIFSVNSKRIKSFFKFFFSQKYIAALLIFLNVTRIGIPWQMDCITGILSLKKTLFSTRLLTQKMFPVFFKREKISNLNF